jgi:phosphodiesterase/alkaline phosphatase D-like protein
MMSIMLPRREAIKKVAKGVASVAGLALVGGSLVMSKAATADVQSLNKTHGIKTVVRSGDPIIDAAIIAAAVRIDPRKPGMFPNRQGGK